MKLFTVKVELLVKAEDESTASNLATSPYDKDKSIVWVNKDISSMTPGIVHMELKKTKEVTK
jgi:hypothetical protein